MSTYWVKYNITGIVQGDNGTNSEGESPHLYFMGYDLYRGAGGGPRTEPRAPVTFVSMKTSYALPNYDPYVYLVSSPIAGATKGYWNANGFTSTGYEVFVLKNTLADSYIVGSKPDPDLAPAPIAKSPIIYDDLYKQYIRQYDYSTYIWAQITIPGSSPNPDAIIARIDGNSSVVEGDLKTTKATYSISLDKPSSKAVTVSYKTSDGSALAGQRYEAATGSHTFAPGETKWSFSVDVKPNYTIDNDQTFSVGILSIESKDYNVVTSVGNLSSIKTTTITDGTPSPAGYSAISEVAKVLGGTNKLIKLLGSLQSYDPIVADDLLMVKKTLGKGIEAIGFGVDITTPLLKFDNDLAIASKISNENTRMDSYWAASRDLDVSIGNTAFKIAFTSVAAAYISAAVASGGIEIYLAGFLAAAGAPIAAPAVIAAAAGIAGGVAISVVYDTYFAPDIKKFLSHNYESSVPVPSSVSLPPQALNFGESVHDAASAGGQVYALYDGLLGRAPDAIGLEGWSAHLKAGASIKDIASGFLASAEGQARAGAADNATFVEQLYQANLDRGSDPGGKAAWVGALDHGTSRTDVALGFALSAEHIANLKSVFDAGVFVPDQTASSVARLYHSVLDRAPDAGGLQGWTGAVKAGASLHTVADTFLKSAEYEVATTGFTDAQFVEQMYGRILGRPGETGGVAAWSGYLDHGGARGTVIDGFTDSLEFQGKYAAQGSAAYVEALYDHIFDRHSDSGGLQNWTSALDSHSLSRTDVAHAFTGSAEFQAKYVGPGAADFVDNLFQHALGRHVDASGLKAWIDALAHGTSRADVAVAISQSTEAQQHLVSEIQQGWHLT